MANIANDADMEYQIGSSLVAIKLQQTVALKLRPSHALKSEKVVTTSKVSCRTEIDVTLFKAAGVHSNIRSGTAKLIRMVETYKLT